MLSYDNFKILWYDIESAPLPVYVWQMGKQVVRHNQLIKGKFSRYNIICITYCWNDGGPAKCIDWGYEKQDTASVVRKFDKIVAQADLVVGKNNTKFDNKMINAARMFAGLPGNPTWTKYTDDLETQMRRHFRLPSQALDYISNELGYGGKIKMDFQDWIDIVEKHPTRGRAALKKMCSYGIKDVEDTRALWDKLSEHFEPKYNMNTVLGAAKGEQLCKNCGSSRLAHRGSARHGITCSYQEYRCLDCNRYAGRARLTSPYKGVIR